MLFKLHNRCWELTTRTIIYYTVISRQHKPQYFFPSENIYFIATRKHPSKWAIAILKVTWFLLIRCYNFNVLHIQQFYSLCMLGEITFFTTGTNITLLKKYVHFYLRAELNNSTLIEKPSFQQWAVSSKKPMNQESWSE